MDLMKFKHNRSRRSNKYFINKIEARAHALARGVRHARNDNFNCNVRFDKKKRIRARPRPFRDQFTRKGKYRSQRAPPLTNSFVRIHPSRSARIVATFISREIIPKGMGEKYWAYV